MQQPIPSDQHVGTQFALQDYKASCAAALIYLLVAALYGALALWEENHIAVFVTQHLNFDVPWLLNELLNEHARVTKRCCCLLRSLIYGLTPHVKHWQTQRQGAHLAAKFVALTQLALVPSNTHALHVWKRTSEKRTAVMTAAATQLLLASPSLTCLSAQPDKLLTLPPPPADALTITGKPISDATVTA